MLPLGQIARSVAGTVFELAGEIVVTHTYTQTTSTAYNAATGNPTPTNATATVNAIVGKYSFKEIDGQRIRVGDEKVIVRVSEMSGIIPSADDYLVAGQVRRDVKDIDIDPTNTFYILQTRKAQA